MNIKDGYDAWAQIYDENENKTRDLELIVAKKIIGGYSFSLLIELGCGTGKNTSWLCQKADQVIALDFSENMLARAREKIKSENVLFRVADLNQPWPVSDSLVGFICCSLVLEHISNLGFIFTEAARVLQTGGWFYICELHPFKQYTGSKARFRQQDSLTVLPCFIHHTSEFMLAAAKNGFRCELLNEWFDSETLQEIPRLISFVFVKT